jgi:heme-degrading monooxygenase HmoA
MWVRVTKFEGGSAEQFDEGLRQIEENVLPPLREMPGFERVISLSTADRSAGLTLTFWESEQALRESEEAANRLRGEAAEAGGDTIAGVERYEVVMDETPGRD